MPYVPLYDQAVVKNILNLARNRDINSLIDMLWFAVYNKHVNYQQFTNTMKEVFEILLNKHD